MANQLFELLKKDHREVEQMMKQILTKPQNQCESLFIDLNDSLAQHMQLEEKFFYPNLQNEQGLKTLMQDAMKEHQETKQLLQKLEQMGCEAGEWKQTFQQMQQGVLHHVQEEEMKVFPKSEQVLGEKECNNIAQKCQKEKEMMQPSKKGAGKETRTQA
jgi:iron-sulfur cluster repair protein YtfE (RIC family)